MPRCRSTSATSTPAGVNGSAVGVVDVSGAVATGCLRRGRALPRVVPRRNSGAAREVVLYGGAAVVGIADDVDRLPQGDDFTAEAK